ncbi:MAG TPA: hypothetical protein VGN12_16900 [Pirellulales bacterium]|jgi:hypothetical protein
MIVVGNSPIIVRAQRIDSYRHNVGLIVAKDFTLSPGQRVNFGRIRTVELYSTLEGNQIAIDP